MIRERRAEALSRSEGEGPGREKSRTTEGGGQMGGGVQTGVPPRQKHISMTPNKGHGLVPH